MAGNLIELTTANWDDEVVKSDVPVLVDFWAAWCGPCLAIEERVKEISGEYVGKVKVGKLDVDGNQEIAERYGIQSIPTLLLLKGGEVVDRVVGAVPKAMIAEAVDRHL